MPLYTITTQAGVLDSPAKADLAGKLTVLVPSSQAMEMGQIMPDVASS
jgi:phenylpyruvate tautomerase PptA (4-oxalocrotonate tautomerase family)